MLGIIANAHINSALACTALAALRQTDMYEVQKKGQAKDVCEKQSPPALLQPLGANTGPPGPVCSLPVVLTTSNLVMFTPLRISVLALLFLRLSSQTATVKCNALVVSFE